MTTVAVAISGGVDSLIAAFLLKQKGHDVVGIHFRTGYEGIAPGPPEAVPPAIASIARQLDIPFEILDLSETFRQTVVAYFTKTYREGRTPNPCLFCNPAIKFGHLLDHVCRKGAQALATGHYARVRRGPDEQCHLYRGVDCGKDQSYFLSRLNQKQLGKAVFPLGAMTKNEVRAIARQNGLVPAAGQESQDICFIKNTTYPVFLQQEEGFRPEPGDIVDRDGHVLGRHQGLHLFTVGQRRGINCPAAEPYYVLALDHEGNRLIVGRKSELAMGTAAVEDVNWINRPTCFPAELNVQIRYRHKNVPAVVVETEPAKAEIQFAQPQNAVTPGQGAAFYRNDECLGGGWIA
jgi:tRNA-specific 2-thiouridylase